MDSQLKMSKFSSIQSSPHNSDFELISSTRQSNGTSPFSSGNSRDYVLTATSSVGRINQMPQPQSSNETVSMQQYIVQTNELKKTRELNNSLVNEMESLSQQLTKVNIDLAQCREEKRQLERELDQSRSLMAQILACQIGGKKKEQEEQMPACVHVQESTEIPSANLPTQLTQQISQPQVQVVQAQIMNEPSHTFDWRPFDLLLENANFDLMVYLNTSDPEETVGTHLLKRLVSMLYQTQDPSIALSIVLVPTATISKRLYEEYFAKKRVNTVYTTDGITATWAKQSSAYPLVCLLTCQTLFVELAHGRLNLDHLCLFVLEKVNVLIPEQDFARCILELQAQKSPYRMIMFSAVMHPDLELMAPKILRPGFLELIIDHPSSIGEEANGGVDALNPNNGSMVQEERIINIDDAQEVCEAPTVVGTQSMERNNQHSPIIDVYEGARVIDIWAEEDEEEENGEGESQQQQQAERDETLVAGLENIFWESHTKEPVRPVEATSNFGFEFANKIFGQRSQQQRQEEEEEEERNRMNGIGGSGNVHVELSSQEPNTIDIYESALESLASESPRSSSPIGTSNNRSSTTNSNQAQQSSGSSQNSFPSLSSLGLSTQMATTSTNSTSNAGFSNIVAILEGRQQREEPDITSTPIGTTDIIEVFGASQETTPNVAGQLVNDPSSFNALFEWQDSVRNDIQQLMSGQQNWAVNMEGLDRRIEQLEDRQDRRGSNEHMLIDLDVRLDEVEEQLGSINVHQIGQLGQDYSDLQNQLTNMESRMQRIEQSGTLKKALLQEYANGLPAERNANGELLLNRPFVYSDDFKELIFIGGSLGYTGIVVNRDAYLSSFDFPFPVGFVDQIIRRAHHSTTSAEMVKWLVLNFPSYDKPQWPSCLENSRSNHFLIEPNNTSAINNGNMQQQHFDNEIFHFTRLPGIKKQAVRPGKVIYTLRNDHSRAKFALEVYFESAEEIYEKMQSFSIRRLN